MFGDIARAAPGCPMVLSAAGVWRGDDESQVGAER
jgi:hypothetical protein